MSAATEVVVAAEKPRLRGVLHQFAAMAAVPAGALLALQARTARASIGALVFALSLVVLYSVSAVYHRKTWGPAARQWMRRLDHASIFILIAGTYTPICLLAVPPALGNKLLLFAWAGAALGVLQSLFWIQAPKALTAAIAVVLGWGIVPYLHEVRAGLQGPEFALILAGGVAYTLGALAYASKRPNPLPGVFGYHEVFHALTLVAGVLHFGAVLSLVLRAH